MAISTLAYKITADTRKFNTELGATRKEIAATKRILTETRSPAEQLEDGLRGLEQLQKKGLLTGENYNRAVRQLKRELSGADAAADKAKISFADVRKELAGSVPILGKFTKGAIGVAAAFAAVSEAARWTMRGVRLVTEQLAELDKTAKTASKLGIGFNELQALTHAAERAGVSTETLNMGMQRLVKRIGLAQQGSKEAQDTFALLGLDFETLAELTPEKQFIAVASAISKMKGSTEQLSAVVKIFDSEAAGLKNLLELDAKAFAEAAKEAEAFGKFASAEEVAELQKANDALRDMSDMLEGVKSGFAIEFTGFIRDLSEITKLLGVPMGPKTVGAFLSRRLLDASGVSALQAVGGALRGEEKPTITVRSPAKEAEAIEEALGGGTTPGRGRRFEKSPQLRKLEQELAEVRLKAFLADVDPVKQIAKQAPVARQQFLANTAALKGSASALEFEQRVMATPRKKELATLAKIEKNTRPRGSRTTDLEVREVGVG